jgi:hypothetical protein
MKLIACFPPHVYFLCYVFHTDPASLDLFLTATKNKDNDDDDVQLCVCLFVCALDCLLSSIFWYCWFRELPLQF